jgi:exopolysaccharide production protein ExoZ
VARVTLVAAAIAQDLRGILAGRGTSDPRRPRSHPVIRMHGSVAPDRPVADHEVNEAVIGRTGEVPRERVLYSIQAIRALAAWSVVVHHYCMIFAVPNPSWWRRGFLDHGWLGVDVFFVVSGFVMGLGAADRTVTPRAFMVKRLARIVPAYWLFTLAVALLITLAPDVMVQQGCSPESLIKSLLFIPSENPGGIGVLPVITVGWTLNYEMVFYLIVAITLFVKLPQRWLWLVIAIVALQQVLVPQGVVSSYYASSLFYEFLMGVLAAHLWRAGALRGRAWWFGCLAVLAMYCLLRAPAPANTLSRELECGVPAFLLVCAALGLEPLFKRAALLKRLGDHSYSVYLIHPAILYSGWYLGGSRHVRYYYALLSIACLAAIALVGAASYRFIEQPAGRWITRRLLPRRPDGP